MIINQQQIHFVLFPKPTLQFIYNSSNPTSKIKVDSLFGYVLVLIVKMSKFSLVKIKIIFPVVKTQLSDFKNTM